MPWYSDTRTVRAIGRRIGWTATGLCLVLTACHAAGPGDGGSRLAGVWEPVDGPPEKLVIRSDGTFDLTGTMLGMAGDPRRLRKTGDALEPEPGNRIEIVCSEIGPESSYIRLKMTHRDDDGRAVAVYAQYDARLERDQRLVVRAGALREAHAARDSVPAVVYRRVGAAPPESVAPGGSPATLPPTDKYIALGRRQFAGANWFEDVRVYPISDDALKSLLVTPRDPQPTRRFLVVHLRAAGPDGVDDWLSTCAARAAMEGCSILLIVIPELEGESDDPEPARLSDLAARVAAQTGIARAQVKAEQCGLWTDAESNYLGHFIWQRDNTPFDGWLFHGWRCFQWYEAAPETDRSKPLLLEMHEHETGWLLERRDAVLAKYRSAGFTNAQPAYYTGRGDYYRSIIRLLGQAIGAQVGNADGRADE